MKEICTYLLFNGNCREAMTFYKQCIDSDDEVSKLFSAISAKGKVTMTLADTFWGARFGMCTDQFGINWMFNFQKTPLKM